MCAKTTCEQAIAIADLYDISLCDAASGKDACSTFCPTLYIALGIGAHDRLTGSARGCMDTSNLRHADSIEAKGIFVTKVVLGSKRQTMYIFNALDILRLDAHLIHLLTIEGHFFIARLDSISQSLGLKLGHGLTVHAFHFAI